MKVIKPLTLGVLTRPFEVKRRFYLGVSVFAFVPLGAEPALHTEQDLWRTAAAALPPTYPVIDEGIPKSRAELLLAGRAFPPERPATTCPVEVSIGAITKAAHVVGPRFWRDGVPTPPEPFESVPLTWENAFGGEGFADNPLGRGYAPVTQDGGRAHPLPLVESPDRLIRSPGERPAPTGFGAIDIRWPQRARFRGTYDDRWLEQEYPGLASDEDWRLWNVAPEDQQRPEPFVGDEAYRLVNLHPTRPVIEGRLPGLSARAFVQRAPVAYRKNEGRPPGELSEVPLRLMTVWLWPEHERAVLVFSGAADVTEDDARDVSLLAIAAERIGAPRPLAHYDAVVDRRCDKDRAGVEAMNDEDLVPGDLVAPFQIYDPDLSSRGLLAKNLHRGLVREHARLVERAVARGVDPAELPPPPGPPPDPEPPPLSEMQARFDEAQAQLDKTRSEVEAAKRELLERAAARAAELGVDPPVTEEDLEAGHRGPPPYSAERERAQLREKARAMAAQGMRMPWLEEQAEDPAAHEVRIAQEQKLRELYRMSAHLQAPARRLEGADNDAAVAELYRALEAGEPLDGRDFTGVDLSGRALDGARLAGALLEAASFAGASLAGADLRGAVLSHADLTGADLSGATLRSANLGGATLTSARTDERTDLRDAQLMNTNAERALLRGANLQGASCLRVRFVGADLSGANLAQVQLIECALEGASFEGARLDSCGFIQADLRGASLDDAIGPEASFVDCTLDGVTLRRAQLENARFVHGTSLRGADLRHARLGRSCFRGADLEGADLGGCDLDQADLGDARLARANLYAASLRRALLIRADLSGATLMHANLMEALLGKADVRDADLRGANLYGADCARIRGDVSTLLEGAETARVRARPRREP